MLFLFLSFLVSVVSLTIIIESKSDDQNVTSMMTMMMTAMMMAMMMMMMMTTMMMMTMWEAETKLEFQAADYLPLLLELPHALQFAFIIVIIIIVIMVKLSTSADYVDKSQFSES